MKQEIECENCGNNQARKEINGFVNHKAQVSIYCTKCGHVHKSYEE